MNLFINATSARMGGALTYLENLARELDASPHGNSITVAIREGVLDIALARIRILKIPARVCDSAFSIFFWQQVTLPRILKRDHYDLLYSTANFSTLFCPCPQVLLIRIPHYFSREYRLHILPRKTWREKLDFTLRKWLLCISMPSATHVLFQTQSSRADALTGFRLLDSKKTSVLWFGTTVSIPSRKESQKNDVIRILCTSHYSDYKNYTSLLEGLCRLKKDHSLQFLFIATINPSLPLFKTLPSAQYDLERMLELGDSLRALGPVPYHELPALYANSDIFVWPSLAETFGQPLIEAMSAGLPIICSDIPVNREICQDAALYVPPLDSKAWSDTLLKLATTESLRTQLVTAGAQRAPLFSWHKHMTGLTNLFSRYDRNQHSDTGV